MMPYKIFLLSIAGALGTVSRYFLSLLFKRFSLGYLGTIFVNCLGCFLFGLILALGNKKFHFKQDLQPIILIGFMGAFTTFSSFVSETVHFINSSKWSLALLNIIIQNVICLVLFIAGFNLIKN